MNNKINFPIGNNVYIHATDTCYGFACAFNDVESISRIQEIKWRDKDKPMSLLFSSIEMIKQFCEVSEKQLKFILSKTEASSFLLKKKEVLKDFFPQQENVSVRIENDNFPVKLSNILNTPTLTTSVNRSGNTPLYWEKDIKEEFKNDKDIFFIKSWELKKNPPSTIWDLTKDKYCILRF